jgi:hypothetical protein
VTGLEMFADSVQTFPDSPKRRGFNSTNGSITVSAVYKYVSPMFAHISFSRDEDATQ